jgi:putative ABC transport system ATP-binding protein
VCGIIYKLSSLEREGEVTGTMIIQMKDVGKVYRNGTIKVEALRNVNLSIQKGEFVAIMGPSGSGKSTLMNIVGCLDRTTSGLYDLDGVNISKLDDVSWQKYGI